MEMCIRDRIYTYGPIIHNEEVVRDLEEKGVRVIDTKEELSALSKGVVIIRSHGVGREIYEILEHNGITVVDATCPFVKKIHRIVKEQGEEGRRVIIVGDESHPEVQGIKGWGNDDTLVIKTACLLYTSFGRIFADGSSVFEVLSCSLRTE